MYHLVMIRSMLSKLDDMGSIQLDNCNTIKGSSSCGLKFDIVVDSGRATITLISGDVVDSNPYLCSLKPIP